MRFYMHLLYDDHSLLDVDGQEFQSADQAREEATVALMELCVGYHDDSAKTPLAIAVFDEGRSIATVIQVSTLRSTFQRKT